VLTQGCLDDGFHVHNGRVTGRRVAEQRPGLPRRRPQGAARIRDVRGLTGFVIGLPSGGEDAKRPFSFAGFHEQQGQRATQEVNAEVTDAVAEKKCLLEDRA
jgi:hypothetical protein